MVSAESEPILDLEIANDNVSFIGTTASETSRRVSILVAARTRILGEALADVLLRTGYEVHLAPRGCGPRAIVVEARAIRPALVLLDLPTRVPSRAMAEAIAHLYSDRVRVVVLGPDASLSSCANGIAVDGWASRSDPLSSLVDTVQRWASIGSAPCARDLDRGPIPGFGVRGLERPPHNSRFELLTSREQQVLMALMDGTPPVKIARQSFAALSTVRHHIRSILLKLNVNSQLAAVAAAYQAGWTQEHRTTPATADPRGVDGLPLRNSSRRTSADGIARASLGVEQVQGLLG
jgi:DNA-binding NarL/FixJ family response regulator